MEIEAFLTGAATGAAITSLAQFWLSTLQRRRELADRRAERKRPVYTEALRRITHLMPDYTEDFIASGGFGDFRQQRERQLADLRLGLLIEGTDAIRKRVNAVEREIEAFFQKDNLERVRAAAEERDANQFYAIQAAYFDHVREPLHALAEEMNRDLGEPRAGWRVRRRRVRPDG